MNKFGKEYISEIKTLFPIKTKKEKAYLKNLEIDVNSYCEETGVTSKQELYDNYGKPLDVVNSYFSSVETEYLVKKLKISKYIKAAIVTILILSSILISVNGIIRWEFHEIAKRQEIVIVEESIVEY